MSKPQWLALPGLVLLVTIALQGDAAASGTGAWLNDFAKAEAEAQRLGRPLLIHFSATWCAPCRRMEREVLHTPELLERIGTSFVAVQVDSDQHPDLVRRYVVRALPCDVVVDPFSGRVIGQSEGYRDLSNYLAAVQRMESQFQQLHQAQLASRTASRPPAQPTLSIDLGASAPIVGLDGYSPVALVQSRTWIKGRAEFAVEHKGILYYLTSAEERSAFVAAPHLYAPQLLGCDPVVLAETDRAIAGTTRFGAFYDGELFLFVSAESRARFREQPARYIRTQHVLRADQIERTALR